MLQHTYNIKILQKHAVTVVILYHVLLIKVLKAIATLIFIFILSFVFLHMLSSILLCVMGSIFIYVIKFIVEINTVNLSY